MRKWMMYMMVMCLSLSLLMTPAAALAIESGAHHVYVSDPSAEAMIGDALILRPVSLLGLGVTSLVFLVGWPFAIAGGNEEAAKQKLLHDPIQFTFERPLGDF